MSPRSRNDVLLRNMSNYRRLDLSANKLKIEKDKSKCYDIDLKLPSDKLSSQIDNFLDSSSVSKSVTDGSASEFS